MHHFWYLFKPQGAHHEMHKMTGVYIGKKNCVQVINIWSFFGLYQLATQIILCFQLLHKTDCVCVCVCVCVFLLLFLWRVQFLSTYYFDIRQAYKLLLVQNRHTNIPNIVCVQSTICDIITKTKYHFRYLLKLHEAHRKIYKTTGYLLKKNCGF
jgi:uncharacterized membrane protein YozB (DUF420 family)